MEPGSQEQADQQRLAAFRSLQQREAARGCLLALVLEGAALLAVILWVFAAALAMPRLQAAAAGAFVVFTLAAAAVGVMLLVHGNLPSQRRLRREARDRSESQRRPEVDAVAERDRSE